MNISKITKQLDRNDFYKTVYQLQRVMTSRNQSSEVGTDSLPCNEGLRLKAAQHLGFPGPDVESIRVCTESDGIERLEVSVNHMGLTGPSAALPTHYTELVMQRTRLKDAAIRDFFDLFNHRLLSLNYRAWEKYQFAIQYKRSLGKEESPIDQLLRALTGANDDVDVYFGGLFAKQNRHSSGVRQILGELSGCRVEIREFVGKWMPLTKSEQTRLGAPSSQKDSMLS